jgi:PKD repeat protein
MTLDRRVWAFSVLLPLLALPGCNDDNNPAGPNGLTVACAAAPASGAAPLAVVFAFKTEGANGSLQVTVNYGDGTSGNDPNAGHVYKTAGAFSAIFDVTTPSQVASCTTGITVSGPSPAPVPTTNEPPNAVFKTTPDAGGGRRIGGAAPLEVRFNMCPTVDPDHDPLLFTMDFQDDGTVDVVGSTGAQCRSSYVYTRPGTYRARVCVTDLSGPGGQPLHPAECQVYDVDVN